MVNSESEVLPSVSGIPRNIVSEQHDDPDTALRLGHDAEEDAEDLVSEIEDVESIFRPRASRPSNDYGWLEKDPKRRLMSLIIAQNPPADEGSNSGQGPLPKREELKLQQQHLLLLQLQLFPLAPREGADRGLSQKQNFGRGSTSEPRSPRFRVHSHERTLGLSPKIFPANKTKPCEANP